MHKIASLLTCRIRSCCTPYVSCDKCDCRIAGNRHASSCRCAFPLLGFLCSFNTLLVLIMQRLSSYEACPAYFSAGEMTVIVSPLRNTVPNLFVVWPSTCSSASSRTTLIWISKALNLPTYDFWFFNWTITLLFLASFNASSGLASMVKTPLYNLSIPEK